MLVKLPNDEFVDPAEVASVTYQFGSKLGPIVFKPTVCVKLKNGQQIVLQAEDDAAAIALCRTIGYKLQDALF